MVGQRQGTLLPIELPADLDALLSDDMAQAKIARDALRHGLQDVIAKGHRIVGFEAGRRLYVIGR